MEETAKETAGFYYCTWASHKSNFLSIIHNQIRAGVIKKGEKKPLLKLSRILNDERTIMRSVLYGLWGIRKCVVMSQQIDSSHSELIDAVAYPHQSIYSMSNAWRPFDFPLMGWLVGKWMLEKFDRCKRKIDATSKPLWKLFIGVGDSAS